jgi:integrase
MSRRRRIPGLYVRGRTYWIKYYVNGRAVRESTGTTKATEAKRILDARRGRVATGQPVLPRADRVRYDDLATALRDHYRTTGRRHLDEVDDHLAHLTPFFRGRRALAITPDVITAYVALRQAEPTQYGKPPANRTINMELAILKRMFRLAGQRGTLAYQPAMEMLKEAPPRAGFFEPDQYEAVRRRLPPDLRLAVTLACTYGWRIRSEVLPLARRHVDLAAGTVRLDPGTTKNDEGRVVYLTPELRGLLAEHLDRLDALARRTGRIVPELFPHLTGRLAGQPRRGFARAWRTACRRAGVPGRLLHDFRRTAVRNLERAGVPRAVAMKVTGHKTESVYRRYAIVNDADLREATRRLTGTMAGTLAPGGLETRPVTPQNVSREALAQPGRAPAF